MSADNPNIRIETSIVDEGIQAGLMGMSRAMQRSIGRKAMREAAYLCLARARQYAPRDTGALAQGLIVRALPRSRTKFGVGVSGPKRELLGLPDTTKGGKPRGYYPVAQEFGWHAGGRKTTKEWVGSRLDTRSGKWYAQRRKQTLKEGGRQIPAHSYMRRAFDETREQMMQVIAQRIGEQVELAWAGKQVPE